MIKIKKKRVRPKGAKFITMNDYSEYSVVYFDIIKPEDGSES